MATINKFSSISIDTNEKTGKKFFTVLCNGDRFNLSISNGEKTLDVEEAAIALKALGKEAAYAQMDKRVYNGSTYISLNTAISREEFEF